MSKYIIYFGKDPEELENGCWSDSFDLTDTETIEKETVGKFETDNNDFFWQILMQIRDNPPAMWYWVFIDEKLMMSGAIDPDDYYNLICDSKIVVPHWVIDIAFDHNNCCDFDNLLDNTEQYVSDFCDRYLYFSEDGFKVLIGQDEDSKEYYFCVEDNEVAIYYNIEEEFPEMSYRDAFYKLMRRELIDRYS